MTRVLVDFEGHWQIERRIEPATGPSGRFAGQAIWSPADDGLAYRETGQLQIIGHAPMQAERRYLWRPDLSVWFEDGRFFHQVPAEGGESRHWCDPDQYDVSYDFNPWPQFSVTWCVKGPAKDYVMVSDYSPLP